MRVMTIDEYIKLPTFIRKINKYQNVNIDPKLRNKMITFFKSEYIEYLNKSKNKNVKKYLPELKGKNGYNIIYNLIKLYVKKTGDNWYDLKNKKRLVINFFNQYLSNI